MHFPAYVFYESTAPNLAMYNRNADFPMCLFTQNRWGKRVFADFPHPKYLCNGAQDVRQQVGLKMYPRAVLSLSLSLSLLSESPCQQLLARKPGRAWVIGALLNWGLSQIRRALHPFLHSDVCLIGANSSLYSFCVHCIK